ncbi:hypothetical protein MO973_20660 [Paenibacillus sp. TRM 82003]|nr:hypothetical protein [Paenibacillus sp. TRM 82003]
MANERGGAGVLMFGLLGIGCCLLLFVVSVQWMLFTHHKTKTKLVLDRASHAASLHIDPSEAAYGRLAWDVSGGTADFDRYLRMNLRLNADGTPSAASPVSVPPIVHSLEFVALPTYPGRVVRSIVVDPGARTETVRTVDAWIYGPSVVAVVEVRPRAIGGRDDPLVLSSVASARFR